MLSFRLKTRSMLTSEKLMPCSSLKCLKSIPCPAALPYVEGAADLMATSQRRQFRVEDLNLSAITTSGN